MAQSDTTVGAAFLAEGREHLAKHLAKIRHCLDQLDDEQVWWRPHESMNSIANILLHLGGNMQQWIVAGIGGEPDVRRRPQEFSERGPIPKSELLRRLQEVSSRVHAVLAATPEAELLRHRRIQGFDVTGLSAIFDSLAHLNGHTQEIIYITRLQLGDRYQFAWKPATPEQGAE
jgi:hypothetical protein